jgi:hypothetical protein
MSYQAIKHLQPSQFKRLCGVKPELFQEMVEVLKSELPKPKQKGGQPKLTVEDQLLIALEYWREYRSYFHMGQSWGVHESTVCRIVHRVEDILIQSQKFHLPGKKTLMSDETEVEAVIVDVGESPIERPQKNSVVTTAEKRRNIPSSLK